MNKEFRLRTKDEIIKDLTNTVDIISVISISILLEHCSVIDYSEWNW